MHVHFAWPIKYCFLHPCTKDTKLEGSEGMPPDKFWKLMPWDCILGHFQSNTDKVDKLYTNS